MKLTILGSGSNVHPTRAAAGYVLQTDQPLLLDFGPRTLANLMKTGVNRHQIQNILFSHFHADHFSDFITFFFDAVYYSRFVGKRGDLRIVGPRGAKHLFGTILKTFPGFRAAKFRVRIREVTDRSFSLGKARITPQTVVHSSRLHCVGYRVEYGGKAFAYSGDSEYCPALVRLCREADLAVLDCSFPANRPGHGHMHAGQCGRVAQEAGVKRLVLSHFYPIADRYNVVQQAGKEYRGRIFRGRDLLRVQA